MTAPGTPRRVRRSLLFAVGAATLVVLALRWADDPPVRPDGPGIDAAAAAPGMGGTPAAAPVAAAAPAAAAPTAPTGDAQRVSDAGAAPPLGDLLVTAEAPAGQRHLVPLVLTSTTADLVSEVVLEQVSDAAGRARFPRPLCVPRQPTDVLCIDLGLPTSGAYAMQFDAATARLDIYVPDRGGLHIVTLEADGEPLRGSALAEIRVLQASPPADRRHFRDLLGGEAMVATEASGLQLEVSVATRDGRRADAVVVTGPVLADAVAECVVRMPPRDMCSVRMLGRDGLPLADTPVEVWVSAPAIRLDEGRATDHEGRLVFPAPRLGGRGLPVALRFLARDAAGHALHGALVANLPPLAATALGDVPMQDCVLLCAGLCVGEDGQPAGGLQLVVQTERPPELGRSPVGGGTWIDLPMQPVRSAADGTFRIEGPPQFGRPLQLRARGKPAFAAPFVEGTPDLHFVLPPPPPRRGFHR